MTSLNEIHCKLPALISKHKFRVLLASWNVFFFLLGYWYRFSFDIRLYIVNAFFWLKGILYYKAVMKSSRKHFSPHSEFIYLFHEICTCMTLKSTCMYNFQWSPLTIPTIESLIEDLLLVIYLKAKKKRLWSLRERIFVSQ